MNKALTKKLLYVITVLAVLAMMIPMAIPVSAGNGPTMTMTVTLNGDPDGAKDQYGIIRGWNILGSIVTVTASGTVNSWDLQNITTEPGYSGANWNPSTVIPAHENSVNVVGQYGEASITANTTDGVSHVNKKWGIIDHTTFTNAPATKFVTWNESAKAWFATGNITDTVTGMFLSEGTHVTHPAQGTILNWYLVTGGALVPTAADSATALNTAMAGLPKAQYTQFVNKAIYNPWNHTSAGWNGTGMKPNGTDAIKTVTGYDGSSTVDIAAWFAETVQVVVVPEYPNDPNRTVIPEITSYGFKAPEFEVIPQVRWAGEKVVLEANFGTGFEEDDVEFYLENQSVGTLEAVSAHDDFTNGDVWTDVRSNGIASAIITSGVNGQADVVAALYDSPNHQHVSNQIKFRVYFLNFYSLTLGDVNGKRAGHNKDDWKPENPYNLNFPNTPIVTTNGTDMTYQKLNVSQDALERATVKGWFMPSSSQISTRSAHQVDLDADGATTGDMGDVIAPAGHYVLPDDWQYLGGAGLHWDIMDDPADTVTATQPLVSYLGNTANTIGPFAPGIEVMTPTGWMVNNPMPDVYTVPGTSPAYQPRQINTVVPNGALNAWDAPMPPAKITFEITSGAGFFKEAYKTSIYYKLVNGSKVYTAPFYQILVPAHEFIPPFNIDAGGGYGWNSYDGVHGPYEFWRIISTVAGPTTSDPTHPTKVEVYSDNHGEAMVWLNGDWNLNLTPWVGDGGFDVQPGATVANSIVKAYAWYPYFRAERNIMSTTVEKEWFWSGQIVGAEPADYPNGTSDSGWTRMVLATGTFTHKTGTFPDETGQSDKRMVWIWICDRDGLRAGALGSLVQWNLMSTTSGVFIPNVNGPISGYNATTLGIIVENGFLSGTKRLANPMDPSSYINSNMNIGYAVTRAPQGTEIDLFNKFYSGYGLKAENFSVAAIEVEGGTSAVVDVVATITTREGQLLRHANLDFTDEEKCDDPLQYGDANQDGKVNMADVVTVERIILGLGTPNAAANAAWDVNPNGTYNVDMGDVVRVEKIILAGN